MIEVYNLIAKTCLPFNEGLSCNILHNVFLMDEQQDMNRQITKCLGELELSCLFMPVGSTASLGQCMWFKCLTPTRGVVHALSFIASASVFPEFCLHLLLQCSNVNDSSCECACR